MKERETAIREGRERSESSPEARPFAFDDLRVLLPDWRRHLRASNKAPLTIDSYLSAGNGLLDFLTGTGMPTAVHDLTREHIESYLVSMHDRRLAPATVAKHYRSLQQLFRWLVEDGELDRSPFERMRPPAVPEQPVEVLTEEELGRLLATCNGQSFENRRDNALLRLLADTGVRASEIMGLSLDDVDFETDVAYVLGKGRRSRAVPFGSRTANALRRYLRVRMRHALAQSTHSLWLGRKGALSNSGLAQMLQRRALEARVENGSSPPVPAHLRPPMASRRRAGNRPHATGRLEKPGNGGTLRRIRRRRARPRGPPPPGPGRTAISAEPRTRSIALDATLSTRPS